VKWLRINQLNLLSKWLPIYYRFEETVGTTLHQIRGESVFDAHKYKVYLRARELLLHNRS